MDANSPERREDSRYRGTGQVGGELVKTLAALGEVVAPARDQMDLTDAGNIREFIRSVQPRWIVNPAAYTAVDKAESEPELAYAINAEAVRVIGGGGPADWRWRDPFFNRLCLRWDGRHPLCGNRRDRAGERLRREQTGGRAGAGEEWRCAHDLSHKLGIWRAGKEFSPDDFEARARA